MAAPAANLLSRNPEDGEAGVLHHRQAGHRPLQGVMDTIDPKMPIYPNHVLLDALEKINTGD